MDNVVYALFDHVSTGVAVLICIGTNCALPP